MSVENPLCRFTTSQGVKLRCLFETLSPLLVEGGIEFSKDGVRIKGASKLAFASVTIPADQDTSLSTYFFSPYLKKSIQVGVAFDSLSSSLSATGPHDAVEFLVLESELNDSKRPSISVRVFNSELGYSYSFKVYLLMIQQPETPKIEKVFQKVVSLPSSQLQKSLRCALKRGAEAQIYTRVSKKGENFIFLRTEGTEASMNHSQSFQDKNKQECLKKEKYSLKYLLLLSKATNLSSCVSIFLCANDDMIYLSYRVGTVGKVLFGLKSIGEDAKDCPLPSFIDGKKVTFEKKSSMKRQTLKRPVRRKRKNISKVVKAEEKEEEKEIKKETKKKSKSIMENFLAK